MDNYQNPSEWVQEFNRRIDNIINTWREIEVEDHERLLIYRLGWWLYFSSFTIARLILVPILAITWGVPDAPKKAWEEFGDD